MRAATTRAVLLAPWQQRDREAPWPRRLLAAAALLACAATAALVPGSGRAIAVGGGGLLLIGLWMALVASLLVQNHPHAARFVPGHVRRLRRVALGSGAVLSVALAAVAGLGLLRPASPALLWLMSATLLTFTAWTMRNWLLWLVLSFGVPVVLGTGLLRELAPLWQALQAAWTAQPLALLAIALLAQGWGVARLFGDGDAAHREAYACHERLRRVSRAGMAGTPDGAAVLGPVGGWFSVPFERATAAWLRHVLRTAGPAPRNVMRRLAVALHGHQHWVRQGVSALVALGIAGLSFIVALAWVGPNVHNHWAKGAYGIAIGLAVMGLNPCLVLPQMLWRTRREQALLRLLPGVPVGAAQNRAVAALQARHAFAAWALSTLVMAGLAWAAGDASLLTMSIVALPVGIACLLRDPARLRAPGSWTTVLPLLLYMALAWGLFGLEKKFGVPALWFIGPSVLLSLALGLWRWRVLQAAPQPLPAGRLG